VGDGGLLTPIDSLRVISLACRAVGGMMKIPLWLAIPAALLGGLALAGRRFAVHETLDWEMVDKPGHLVDINGYRVHYEERGSGPAFVMIHGFGGSTFSYRHLMAAFAEDHRCIAVDLKGFGYSERKPGEDFSHTAQVAMLATLLERLGVETAVFIGHSMGGAVVLRFAATYPERVDALVLAASVTGDGRMNRHARPPAALVRPVLPLLAGAAARGLLKASFYDKTLLTPALRETYLRPALLRGSMDGLLGMMRDGATDPSIDHSRITMPVLLLYGAHDRVVPLSAAQRLRDRIPHARLVVIDRAAHLLLEERPDDCARAIRDFLRDTTRTPEALSAAT
jgi:pimeloyl-ACP methyl ester carboxylesterase